MCVRGCVLVRHVALSSVETTLCGSEFRNSPSKTFGSLKKLAGLP
jgi:hypothetical protein